MKGRVVKSFSDSVYGVRGDVGDVVEIPVTADWVEAGLVVLIEERPRKVAKRQRAVRPQGETAVLAAAETKSGSRSRSKKK